MPSLVTTIEISELETTAAYGYVINGVDGLDYSGNSVSNAGDVNNDGLDDIIIGAYQADPDGDSSAGSSYVVFGTDSTNAIDLQYIEGVLGNGFVINGYDI